MIGLRGWIGWRVVHHLTFGLQTTCLGLQLQALAWQNQVMLAPLGPTEELEKARFLVNDFLQKNRFEVGKANSTRSTLCSRTYPLHEAVKQDNAYIVSKLLLFGADPSLKDMCLGQPWPPWPSFQMMGRKPQKEQLVYVTYVCLLSSSPLMIDMIRSWYMFCFFPVFKGLKITHLTVCCPCKYHRRDVQDVNLLDVFIGLKFAGTIYTAWYFANYIKQMLDLCWLQLNQVYQTIPWWFLFCNYTNYIRYNNSYETILQSSP